MSRSKILLISTLLVSAVAILFTVFIAVKNDAALVAALSAAGTVTAAGFAAVAAVGSMRAATESSAAAKRTQEGMARTMRPSLRLGVERENGKLVGKVWPGEGHPAVDVMTVWILSGRESVTAQVARLDQVLTLDLNLPDSVGLSEALNMAWIEYWDDSHVGRWRDTWNAGPSGETLVQTESKLAS